MQCIELLSTIERYFVNKDFIKLQPQKLVCPDYPDTFRPGIYLPFLENDELLKDAKLPMRYFFLDRVVRHVDFDRIGFDIFHSSYIWCGSVMFAEKQKGNAYEAKEQIIMQVAEVLFEHLRIPKDSILIRLFGGGIIKNLQLGSDNISEEIWKKYGISSFEFIPGTFSFHIVNKDKNPAGLQIRIFYTDEKFKNPLEIVVITYDRLMFNKSENRLLHWNHDLFVSKFYIENLATILEGKRLSYDTTLFSPVADLIHNKLVENGLQDFAELNWREIFCIADLLRTVVFIIGDGIELDSSTQSRRLKQLVKKIIRIGNSLSLGLDDFLDNAIEIYCNIFGEYFPGLRFEVNNIKKLIWDIINRYVTI